MTVDVLTKDGAKAGSIELPASVFGIEPSEHAMYLAVRAYLAHRRQGTHKVKTRAEVSGGGKKPFKQKGTGRARQGSIRTPLRPGGGIVFGPKPRSYSLSLNRKERRLALRTALMSRVEDIMVVKGFGDTLEAPKTKEITAALQRLGIASDTRVLLVLDGASEAVKLSVRNLERVKLIAADQLNVFDLLNAQKLVLNEGALAKIQEVYSDG